MGLERVILLPSVCHQQAITVTVLLSAQNVLHAHLSDLFLSEGSWLALSLTLG